MWAFAQDIIWKTDFTNCLWMFDVAI